MWPDPCQPQGDALRFSQVDELGEFRCALRVDERDVLRIDHQHSQWCVPGDDLADALIERVGGGEERAPLQTDNGDAGEGLIGGVEFDIAEDLGAGLAAEQ